MDQFSPVHDFYSLIRVGIPRRYERIPQVNILGYSLTDEDRDFFDKERQRSLTRGIAEIDFTNSDPDMRFVIQVPIKDNESTLYVKKIDKWEALPKQYIIDQKYGQWIGYIEAEIGPNDPPIAVG